MPKHPGGRPIEWTPAKVKRLRQAFMDYLYEKDGDDYVNSVPSVSEFAFRNKVRRQLLYEHPDFQDALELCKAKRERDLELGGLSGTINPSMAIFGLKQLGWADHSPESPENFDKDKSVLEQLLQ